MHPRAALLAAITFVASVSIGLSGCTTVQEHQRLVTVLEQKGFTVDKHINYANLPFFTPDGYELVVNSDKSVMVFEYPNDVSARTEASIITKDGTPSFPSAWKWGNPPYFFMGDAAIIVFVGTDRPLIDALIGAYGQPFAYQRK